MHVVRMCVCEFGCFICSVNVYSPEGNRIAQSTGLEILLQGDFDLKINDFKYRITVPQNCESSGRGRGRG